jgi:hypothetical protein
MRTRLLKVCLLSLWLVALCALCLGFAESREGKSVARWQLADDGSAAMSCAEEPSSSNEPLWCAHPDSPHCTRGTPTPSNAESWLGPVFASTPAALALPRLVSERTGSAPSTAALLGFAQSEAERLERPPRRG